MIKAMVLLDQSRRDWKEIKCLWVQSGKFYQIPELVDIHVQADCYLVIASANLSTIAGLAIVQKKAEFDQNKPVIWIDHDREVADIFGSTSQMIAEIRAKEHDSERNIRRLIARLLVS